MLECINKPIILLNPACATQTLAKLRNQLHTLPTCLPACLHMHDRLTGIYFHVWWLFLHGVMRVSGVPVDTYRVGFEIYWKGTWTSTSCLARLQVWYILPYIHTVYTVHTRHVGRGTWNMDGMWKRVEVILINRKAAGHTVHGCEVGNRSSPPTPSSPHLSLRLDPMKLLVGGMDVSRDACMHAFVR